MLSNEEKWNALVWKCDQVGLTYGKYISQCSNTEIEGIYKEYESKFHVHRMNGNTQKKSKRHSD